MAITIAITHDEVHGNKLVKRGTVTFDDSYPANGEDFTPGQFGLMSLDQLTVYPKSGYVFEPDYTNKKILAYWADYDAGADGALIEVLATTNLSAVVARFEAIGV